MSSINGTNFNGSLLPAELARVEYAFAKASRRLGRETQASWSACGRSCASVGSDGRASSAWPNGALAHPIIGYAKDGAIPRDRCSPERWKGSASTTFTGTGDGSLRPLCEAVITRINYLSR